MYPANTLQTVSYCLREVWAVRLHSLIIIKFYNIYASIYFSETVKISNCIGYPIVKFGTDQVNIYNIILKFVIYFHFQVVPL